MTARDSSKTLAGSSRETYGCTQADILRRTQQGGPLQRVLKSGPFLINFVTLTVRRGRTVLNLSLRELRLLEVFITHPRRVLSRGALVNLAWDHDAKPLPRTVDVHIGSLRKKLGDSEIKPIIQTLEREGHRWLLPVSPARSRE